MASASPDTHSRSLPSVWTAQDSLGDIAEALDALETYKKKDVSKGTYPTHLRAEISDTLTRPPSVVVRFKAVGNAPIMRQNFYKITASNRFQAVIQFLRKELGWKAGDPLVCSKLLWTREFLTPRFILQFTYINLAFSPAPDDTVSNLYKVWIAVLHCLTRVLTTSRQSFSTDGHLIVNYR